MEHQEPSAVCPWRLSMEDSSLSKGKKKRWKLSNIFGGCAIANGECLDTNRTITRGEYKNTFNASSFSWGYPDFMPLIELHDPQKGFIVNDVCIVGAKVFVGKHMPTPENRVSQVASLTGHTNVDVQNLKLEGKDTDDKACEDLQVLWEELGKYRSDLTWLEPHVQSALGIKNYEEKALYVEKLKKNVTDHELETKRLKTKLVAAEKNLDMERDLLKEKGIQERDKWSLSLALEIFILLIMHTKFKFVEIERQETNAEIQPFEKFTWKIENFSYLTNLKKIYSQSQPFVLGSYLWRIVLYPTGNKRKDAVDDLSIYLQALETANESEGWSRDVKVKLVVFNQLNTNMTIIRENKHDYNAKEDNRGFASFMSLTELHNPEKGFIVKDACIVGAEVLVSKSSCEKQVSVEPTKQVDAELGYVEKVTEAEKLKENMVFLELEMERLKVKSVAAEANVDIERNLLKSKGFEEIDLDSPLTFF
ncbi:hypothetical protein P8452_62757 [Trifolium repens]|nr:hypothetical protein P8452_62757 [Trifolium repens]